MNALPNQCPICGGGITVTRFHCDECDVTIEGRFTVGKFAQLSNEQMQFVEAFIRNEGKISRMESELDLSYPTIRARLHDVIRKMGYEPGKDESSAPTAPSAPKPGSAVSSASASWTTWTTAASRPKWPWKMLNPEE